MIFSFQSESYGDQYYEDELQSDTVRGRVIAILEGEAPKGGEEQYDGYDIFTQTAQVEITSGKFSGEVVRVEHSLSGNPAYDFYIDEGDEVLLWVETRDDQLVNVYVSDLARDNILMYLTGIFVVMLLVIGGLKGLKTIITLAITGASIIFVLLPLILGGFNPIMSTILVSAVVTVISLTIISGFNKKTLAAIIGTVGGVITAGVIALLVGTAANLTGLSNEEAQMLMFIPQATDFDFQGLLFAGIIIGALGAVLDVGMSVASSMDEIQKANPSMARINLIKAGMNVGRDIMGTMSNTLILAYTGGAMPLLLLFMAYETPFARVINMDLIATEVVRALSGSIGLILAIPITAIAAGLMMAKNR